MTFFQYLVHFRHIKLSSSSNVKIYHNVKMFPFLVTWICISNAIQLESVNAKRKQYEFSLLQMRTMVDCCCGIVFHFSFYVRFFHSCVFFLYLVAKSLSKINLSVFCRVLFFLKLLSIQLKAIEIDLNEKKRISNDLLVSIT